MLEREIYQHFKIYPEEIMHIGDDQVIFAEGKWYLLRQVDGIEHRLLEKTLMGQWLQYHGDENVAVYLEPEGKRNTIKVDGKTIVVFQLPSGSSRGNVMKGGFGQHLAKLHQTGYTYIPNVKPQDHLQWKERWERRVDQLENWYVNITKSTSKTAFDKKFCLTFPYFLGVSENAIQMLANIVIDNFSYQVVPKTICHVRFQENTWLTISEGEDANIKVPTDFTHDHFTRDISEYIRSIWINQEYGAVRGKLVESFLNDYESVHRLTLIDQKLLVARLLFPLHYFDSIESYYKTQEAREKLAILCEGIFDHTSDYEQLFVFLKRRYLELNNQKSFPEWLTHSIHSIKS